MAKTKTKPRATMILGRQTMQAHYYVYDGNSGAPVGLAHCDGDGGFIIKFKHRGIFDRQLSLTLSPVGEEIGKDDAA